MTKNRCLATILGSCACEQLRLIMPIKLKTRYIRIISVVLSVVLLGVMKGMYAFWIRQQYTIHFCVFFVLLWEAQEII